jgi:VWFA-related protein
MQEDTALVKQTRWIVLAWLLSCGFWLHAATPQIPGRPPGLPPTVLPDRPLLGPRTENPTAQEDRLPVFRTSVEFVEVTVIATDREGHFVGDLQPDDFELLDEGKSQQIRAFTKIDIPLPAPSLFRQAGASHPDVVLPDDVATSALDPDTRLFVLVLDDLQVTSGNTLRVRQAARQFVERYTSPADLVSVVLPSGRKDLLLGFTRDRASVFTVIDTFMGQKLRSATYERYLDERLGGGSALREGRDPSDAERAYRARVSMATLADTTQALAELRGRRKSILYFSEGIDYNVADIMGSVQRFASEVTRSIASTLSAATRANVTVYAIDPRGLATVDDDATEMPIYKERQITSLTEPGRDGELRQSTTNLRDLAETTGGFALTDQNEFESAFERIAQENSSYYILGFQPSGHATAGAFRRLQVRVKRPGITVNARRGYLVGRDRPGTPPPVEVPNLSAALVPLLSRALPDPGLAIRLQAIPFKGTASRTRVHLVVEVDGRDLAFVREKSRFAETLELATLTVDADGQADNGRRVTLALKLTPEELAGAKAMGVRWQSALDLAPGRYQVRAAAHSVTNARRGLAIAEIDVPDFSTGRAALSGIALSSLPTVLAITSGEPPPFTHGTAPPGAARQFVVGDRITAAFHVYPGSRTVDVLRVTAQIDTVGQDARPTPLATTRRVAVIPPLDREEMAFDFDTSALAPGHYVLHVRASADGNGVVALRSVPFAVVPPPPR